MRELADRHRAEAAGQQREMARLRQQQQQESEALRAEAEALRQKLREVETERAAAVSGWEREALARRDSEASERRLIRALHELKELDRRRQHMQQVSRAAAARESLAASASRANATEAPGAGRGRAGSAAARRALGPKSVPASRQGAQSTETGAGSLSLDLTLSPGVSQAAGDSFEAGDIAGLRRQALELAAAAVGEGREAAFDARRAAERALLSAQDSERRQAGSAVSTAPAHLRAYGLGYRAAVLALAAPERPTSEALAAALSGRGFRCIALDLSDPGVGECQQEAQVPEEALTALRGRAGEVAAGLRSSLPPALMLCQTWIVLRSGGGGMLSVLRSEAGQRGYLLLEHEAATDVVSRVRWDQAQCRLAHPGRRARLAPFGDAGGGGRSCYPRAGSARRPSCPGGSVRVVCPRFRRRRPAAETQGTAAGRGIPGSPPRARVEPRHATRGQPLARRGRRGCLIADLVGVGGL